MSERAERARSEAQPSEGRSGGRSRPPLLLAVDTATEVASWALWRGDALVAERAAERGRPTAEALLPALDALLEGAGLDLDDVDGFAVSIGPGSFTGLRIGLATVKGLALEPARPAASIPTLAALAGHAAPAEQVVALLDARRGELYAAGFSLAADGRITPAPWLPEGVVGAAELVRRLPPGCRAVGEPGPEARAALAAGGIEVAVPPDSPTTASHVAALGARAFAAGLAARAGGLVPRYLRRAEAEVKRTGERFEPRGELL